jgi:DNA polymerase-1
MDAAALEKDWGIRPDQVVDFLALTGDSVDNVPGVPGIGAGYAATFLKEFGTLDALLAHPERVKGPKKQQALREHAETARRARRLVTLRDDLPLEIDWEALKTQPPDRDALLALCTECSFHGFRNDLGPPPAAKREAGPAWVADYRLVDNPGSFAAFLGELKRQAKFCVDTETTSLDPLRAELVGLSFSWKEGEAYYLPVRGPEGAPRLDEAATLGALRPILEGPAVEKVGQNVKYDMLALHGAGIELGGTITDTMILSYLLESGERNHNLDQLSQRLLDHEMIPITALIGKGKAQRRMDEVDVAKVAEYAGVEDAGGRAEHRAGRPRGAGAEAPAAGLAPAASAARQAQEHVSRRAAGAGAPRRWPDPRVVQPGHHRDRAAQLERPEPPEHPGPHRGGTADPPGVRPRPPGLVVAHGRLLADRAADPRPLLR